MTTPQPMTAASLAEAFFEVDAKHENAMLDDTGRYHAYAEAALALVTTFAERERGEAIEQALDTCMGIKELPREHDDFGRGWHAGWNAAKVAVDKGIRALSPTTEPTRQGNERDG